jgi:hypothetical protein
MRSVIALHLHGGDDSRHQNCLGREPGRCGDDGGEIECQTQQNPPGDERSGEWRDRQCPPPGRHDVHCPASGEEEQDDDRSDGQQAPHPRRHALSP